MRQISARRGRARSSERGGVCTTHVEAATTHRACLAGIAHPERMTTRRRYTAEEKDAAVRQVRDFARTSKDVGKELGINPSTLAGWVRADHILRRGQMWKRRVHAHFDFLLEYGFALTDVHASDWWKVQVIYRSPSAAVDVSESLEYDRVDLSLLRLVGGALPEYPLFVVDSIPINTFHADWLLRLRADPSQTPGSGLDETSLEAQLAFWASALREHAADFLTGDLAVLDQLEHLIRANARRHGPPTVTVWMPEGTATASADAAAGDVRQVVPPEVAVVARRYRRAARPNTN